MSGPRLEDLDRCFQGVVPAVLSTCGADGEPNVTYLSQVHYVDPRHVALSCQFFNKTRRNVAENPYATILLYDPISFECYRLRLRFEHAETEGPLFEKMSLRIDVIAAHTGMAGIFKLISADVYELLSLERQDAYLLPSDPLLDSAPLPVFGQGPLTELRGLQVVSDRIARAGSLDELLRDTLTALDEALGFAHSMVLLAEPGGRLASVATRGYGDQPAGASIPAGAGLIGTVARVRRMLRVSALGAELRYHQAIRERVREHDGDASLTPEVPLPGLADPQAQLALPLLAGERLVGVLAVESRDPLQFDEWDEAYLQIVANQIALGIERLREAPAHQAATDRRVRRFVFYRNDDCVFVDGEYLVRNLPGKILWKLLELHRREGRREFTNRELRLDPTLGLPAYKDNLESRLILLRKRLAERCPDVRLVPVRRGRFALELDCEAELLEKETA